MRISFVENELGDGSPAISVHVSAGSLDSGKQYLAERVAHEHKLWEEVRDLDPQSDEWSALWTAKARVEAMKRLLAEMENANAPKDDGGAERPSP